MSCARKAPADAGRARAGRSGLALALGERGVKVLPLGPDVLRFVTHMDVGVADVERLEGALREILG